jgi:hypothetical protein
VVAHFVVAAYGSRLTLSRHQLRRRLIAKVTQTPMVL